MVLKYFQKISMDQTVTFKYLKKKCVRLISIEVYQKSYNDGLIQLFPKILITIGLREGCEPIRTYRRLYQDFLCIFKQFLMMKTVHHYPIDENSLSIWRNSLTFSVREILTLFP